VRRDGLLNLLHSQNAHTPEVKPILVPKVRRPYQRGLATWTTENRPHFDGVKQEIGDRTGLSAPRADSNCRCYVKRKDLSEQTGSCISIEAQIDICHS
jgi:hypothetical protein